MSKNVQFKNLVWTWIDLYKGYKKVGLHVPFGYILKELWSFDVLKQLYLSQN